MRGSGGARDDRCSSSPSLVSRRSRFTGKRGTTGGELLAGMRRRDFGGCAVPRNLVPRRGTCPLKGALLTDPAGLVPTTLSPLSPFARWALASRYKASGSATCQRKGETASHKPGLPLPALVRWGAGRAVSGEPRWFVVNPSGFPMRPEERRVISRPDGAVGFWGCAVPRNIVPRWGTTN